MFQKIFTEQHHNKTTIISIFVCVYAFPNNQAYYINELSDFLA